MSLTSLLERKLVCCSPETSIQQAAQSMQDKNVGAVLVVTDEKPLGIVTDRDIVLRCVVPGVNCATEPVSKIMTKKLSTATVNDGIYDIIRVMKQNEVRRVPIVDLAGKAVGLLSFGDILQLLGKEFNDLTSSSTSEEPKLVQRAA